jgi:hypothetical protein
MKIMCSWDILKENIKMKNSAFLSKKNKIIEIEGR